MTLPERAVAGSILIDSACLSAVRAIVSADDFQADGFAEVYRAACRLQDAGQKIDPVTIQANAAKHGKELSVEFLIGLMEVTPTAANVEEYARLVKEASTRRQFAEFGRQMMNMVEDTENGASDLSAFASETLKRIQGGSASAVVPAADAARAFLEYREQIAEKGGAVVQTGYRKIDQTLGGGLVKSGLYILAARPGIGKTTLALKIADYVAKKKPVLFVSLEMSREQIVARLAAERTAMDIGKVLLSDRLTDDECVKVCSAVADIAETNLHINSILKTTVSDISVMAHAIPDLALIVIDYLGLIKNNQAKGSIYERTTANSNDLKQLALSMNIPILCLAQLNRELEKRADGRPAVSDLRDSGAIEQDADGIFLLHRPEYNGQERKPYEPEPMELYVAKNRHGTRGKIELSFYANNGRVRE